MSDLSDDPYITAEGLGKVVVLPAINEIFVDLDSGDDTALQEGLQLCAELGVGIVEEKRIPSKTPGHYHVYLKTEFELNPERRIAFQAIFGSDKKRELLSMIRVIWAIPRDPTLFFEDPS